MKKIHATGLFVGLWAALTLAAMARAAATDGIGGAMIAAAFWGIVQGAGLIYACTHDSPPAKQLTDGVAAVGMLAWIIELIANGILPASMSLLLWLQAARNPGLRTRRDVYFALGISFTLMMFGAAEARSGAFLALMTAYAFAVLAVLVYCYQQSGFDQELPVQQGATARAPASLPMRHIAMLSGVVFLFAMGWYLLVPRPDPLHVGVVPITGGDKYSRKDWEREARNDDGTEARAETEGEDPKDQADPGKQSGKERQPDDTLDTTRSANDNGAGVANRILMYVKADRSLYLRSRTFDHFQNDRWRDTDSRTRKLLPAEGKFSLPGPQAGTDVQYVVQVVSPIGSALPLSAHASSIKAPAGVIAQSRSGTVFLASDIEPGFHYSAVSQLPENLDRPVAHDTLAERSRYLQLPEGFSPRIGHLAQQVTADATSPFHKAMALETHLRSTYGYSFETIFTSQNVTPLESFLFDTRRGHCEFFASAMAAMLRSIDIPSRVVHGYLAHTFNPVTGFYEVQTFDGHAWVEAYIDGVGWVTFEPTAAYPLPQRQQQTGTTLIDLKTYTEQLAEQERLQGKAGLLASVAAVFGKLTALWHLLLLQMQLWIDALKVWIGASYPQLVALLSGMGMAGLLTYRWRAHLVWRWARMMVRIAPAADLPLTAFRQLERVARACNSGRQASETVDDYLLRLAGAHAGLDAESRLLRRAFNAARYGNRKLAAENGNAVLDAFYKIGAAVIGAR